MRHTSWALLSLWLIPAFPSHAGDLTSALAAFPFAHERQVDEDALRQGKVLGARVPSNGRGLSMSVESFYLLPAAPRDVVTLMIDSTSATGTAASETLSIDGHYVISTPPQIGDFSPFSLEGEKAARLGFGGSRMLEADVAHLNLSRDEADRLTKAAADTASLESAWKTVLLNRAAAFHSGGLMNSAPYASNGNPFDVRQELVAILKSRPEVLGHFQDLLGVIMTGKPVDEMLRPSHYWQNHHLQGQKTVTMAYIAARPRQSGYQVVDCTYFVTGGYYTSLILYELQPVTIDGRPQTLAWRADYVISESINFLKGIERMAAEKIMLLEIKKSVESFIGEVERKH